MAQAIFFDLDGTLYDRDETIRGILAEQEQMFEEQLRHLSRRAFVARAIELDNHGYCRTRQVYETLATEFGLPGALAERLIAHYWARFDHHCRPGVDVIATLESLRRHGKQLGIITNGTTEFQQHKVDVLGLRPLMDAVLVSEAEGVSKPSREIFERAAARVGVAVSECCYVGDHPEFDVAGAAAAGMLAIWKRTPYWSLASPAPAIDALRELLPLAGAG